MQTMSRTSALAILCVLAAVAPAQRTSIFGRKQKPEADESGFILQAGRGIPVQLDKEVILAKLHKAKPNSFGREIEVSVISNPTPFRSAVDPDARLPEGYKLRAHVIGIEKKEVGGKTKYTAAIVFDQLVRPDGEVQPFIGGMSSSDPGGLPRWVEDRKMKNESHAASMESLIGVVIPWAAELGPIGIGAFSFFTHVYQKVKLQKKTYQDARLAAVTYLDDDLPVSKFYVVPTLNVRVKS